MLSLGIGKVTVERAYEFVLQVALELRPAGASQIQGEDAGRVVTTLEHDEHLNAATTALGRGHSAQSK